MTTFDKHTHTQQTGQPAGQPAGLPVDAHSAATHHDCLNPASPAPHNLAAMQQWLALTFGQLRERRSARRRPAAARQLSAALLFALALSLLGLLGLSGWR